MKSKNEGLVLISGDQVVPKPIEFLWLGMIARGKLHVLAGAAGTGKTSLAIDLAARFTVGSVWPDGTPAPLGNVIMYSQEDAFDDCLVPRLIAAGGDPKRFHHIVGVRRGDDTTSFDPTSDFAQLRAQLDSFDGPTILIVDPLTAVISGDSHKNAEVRRGLQPLVQLAEEKGCAIIGITHFTKGTSGSEPLERVTGSLAFGALPRVVWVVAKNPSELGSRRVICRAKSNFGPDGGGFEFDVGEARLSEFGDLQTSRVVWGKPLSGSAREIMNSVEPRPDADSARSSATQWLKEFLADGPMPAATVIGAAKDVGISYTTLQRASKTVNVDKAKTGMSGGWTWSIPDVEPHAEYFITSPEDSEEFTSIGMKSSKSSSFRSDAESLTERAAIMEFDGRFNERDAKRGDRGLKSFAQIAHESGYGGSR
jgi:putative DNA primase/helicase